MRAGRIATIILVLATGGVAAIAPAADRRPPGTGGFGTSGRLFISPMGEPFRKAQGGPSPIEAWFAQADADHDGRLTLAEFRADAARFFGMLDTNGDGEIDPDEIDHYETVVAPEIGVAGGGGGEPSGGGMRRGGGGGHRGGGGGGGGGFGRRGQGGSQEGPENGGGGAPAAYPERQGAARFGLLDLPEPVIAADTDFNRGVSRKEFDDAARRRFALLDQANDGALTLDALRQHRAGPAAKH